MTDLVEIKTPDWLPAAVLAMANFLVGMAPDLPADTEAVLTRLLIDERMKGVWQELGKHKREGAPTAERFYKAVLPAAVQSWAGLAEAWRGRATDYRALGDEATATRYEDYAVAAEARQASHPPQPLNEEEQRGMVLAMVFTLAVSSYLGGLEMVSRTALQRHTDDLRGRGQGLVADALEDQTKNPESAKFIVNRKRSDPRINAFVEGMAKEMRTMFGQDMPGVIATITNVAFDRSDYDRDRIRALLKARC